MPTATLQQQTLHYQESGHGTPLICLSANPGDGRDFDAVAPALARRYRVIRPDWPGYGKSPAPAPPERAGAGYFLAVFTQFVEQLGLARFHIIGNSVGGNVAVRYALTQPGRVASLVLVSPGGFTRHNFFTRAFCRLQGRAGFKRLLGDRFTRFYLRRRTECTRAMITRAGAEQNTPVAQRVNAAVWRSFLDPAHGLLNAASGITTPTLVVSGRRDPVIPAARDGRYAAAVIPGARQVVLNCGHAPFAELPEEFLDTVEPFLMNAEAGHAAR